MPKLKKVKVPRPKPPTKSQAMADLQAANNLNQLKAALVSLLS